MISKNFSEIKIIKIPKVKFIKLNFKSIIFLIKGITIFFEINIVRKIKSNKSAPLEPVLISKKKVIIVKKSFCKFKKFNIDIFIEKNEYK